MILGNFVPTLEQVSYVNISGWLEIERQSAVDMRKRDGQSSRQKAASSSVIKSIKWAGQEENSLGRPMKARKKVASKTPTNPSELPEDRPVGVEDRSPTRGGKLTPVIVGNEHRKITVYDPFLAGTSNPIPSLSLTSTLSLLSSCSPPPALTLPSTSAIARFAGARNPAVNVFNPLRMCNSHPYLSILLGRILTITGSSSSSAASSSLSSSSHLAASTPSDSNSQSLQSSSTAPSSSSSTNNNNNPGLVPSLSRIPNHSNSNLHHST
ncbi:hypothetical protein PGTUg99_022908 [Puccinia graminis f. sp. tritici]|uniref:Uncharacterized protein n=1 Tax=Puccinia graminis f. sp. tritici TaxID=56615 RepID=A0A5B0RVQ2_PUCGR|nr:hypothetical protein PGTUg99_022908 [Puccinia graminis f. sp. tritici]